MHAANKLQRNGSGAIQLAFFEERNKKIAGLDLDFLLSSVLYWAALLLPIYYSKYQPGKLASYMSWFRELATEIQFIHVFSSEDRSVDQLKHGNMCAKHVEELEEGLFKSHFPCAFCSSYISCTDK